jgi:predicted porin
MKKLKIISLVLLNILASVDACASVTLYGLQDIGPTYVSNVGKGSVFELQDGVVQQSRWGLTGDEDLGGGYHAGFKLESGFSLTNGQLSSGLAFSRKAIVSLSGPFGVFSMGRDTSVLDDTLGPYTASMLVYGPGYPSIHPGNYDHVFGTQYNSVSKYVSRPIGGVTFRLSAALGGQPGSIVQNSSFDGGVTYASGHLSLGLGVQREYGVNGGDVLLQSQANPFGQTGDPLNHQDSYGFGGSYDFGILFAHALITQAHIYGSGTTGRTYEVGVKSTFSPFLIFGLNYNRTLVRKKAGMGIISASADYYLSKTTDLYFLVAHEDVSGTSASGAPLVAQMVIFSPSSGRSQTAVHMGVRHLF